MSTLKIKAHELVDTDVQLVSLVKRGANRIPFRIVKEDDNMIDLHKIGKSLFRKADPKPEIVAAIVQKGADLDKVAALFKAAGLDVKSFQKSEKDGIVTIAKADYADAQDAAVVKMSDDVAVVVAGLKKAFSGYAITSGSFAEVLATEGFYSSVCTATEALRTTIHNVLYEAQSPSDASSSVGKAVEEFKTYLTTLIGGLPVQAFKLDVDVAKASTGITESSPSETGGAGKNGTGAGVEGGKDTGTTPAATSDDKANTEVNSTGEPVHGNSDEAPVNAKKEGDKDEAKDKEKDKDVEKSSDKESDKEDEKDVEKSKDKAKKDEVAGLPDPKGHESGDPDGFAAAPTDTERAEAAGSADDEKMKLNGGTSGSSIPDGNPGLDRVGGVLHKNEGDEKAGKPNKDNQLDDETSGAGAQSGEKVPHAKADSSEILAAIAALQKSVNESIAAVKTDVAAVSTRVEEVAVMAKKTDEELHGTVFAEAGGDAGRVAKSETAGAPPLLDTAYSRRSIA